MSAILAMLLGASAGQIVLEDIGVSSVGAAFFELTNDGTYTGSDGADDDWLQPASSGLAAQCSVTATLESGSLDTGTTGSELNLGTSRSWSTDSSAVLTLTFAGQAGVKSVTLTLTAL